MAKEINAAGGDATPFVADVSVYEEAQRLVRFAVSAHGRLDFAFNNAGITPPLADVHEIAAQDWLDVIGVNLTGVFFCMKAELAHLVGHGGGAIVNMASTAGVMAHAGRDAYSASKHGIVGLTRSAAVE